MVVIPESGSGAYIAGRPMSGTSWAAGRADARRRSRRELGCWRELGDHPEIDVIAERLVADIPHAHGVVMPAADHYLPLRVPERLTDVLLPRLS
jgi:hypothetical protein